MEENYIRIFCTYLARLLDRDELTVDDIKFLIPEFNSAAPGIASRAGLLEFLARFPQYPQLEGLRNELLDPAHEFTFNDSIGEE